MLPSTESNVDLTHVDLRESGLPDLSSPPRTTDILKNELITPVFTEAVLSLDSDVNATDSSDDFEFLGTSNNPTNTSSSALNAVSASWTCSACTYNHFSPVESSFLQCAVCGTARDEHTTNAVVKPEDKSITQEQLICLDQEYDSDQIDSAEEIYVIDDDDDEDYEQDGFNIATKSTRSTRASKAKIKNNKKQKSGIENISLQPHHAQSISDNFDQLTPLSHDNAIKYEISQVEEISQKPESQPLGVGRVVRIVHGDRSQVAGHLPLNHPLATTTDSVAANDKEKGRR